MKNLSITRSMNGILLVLLKTEKRSAYGLLLLFFMASFVAQSQNLTAFMNASKKEGVNSIPYDDLFEQAGDLQGDKNAAHKALEGYSASGLKTSKVNLLRIKKEMQEDREEAEKKLAADDKKSSSVTNNLKSTLAKVIDEQKKLEGEITTLNAKISDGLEKRVAINLIRAEITKVYAKVDDKLDASLSNPTPHIGAKPSASDVAATKKYNADLTALKGYISTIKSKNEKGFESHKTEIADSLAAENTLREALALH
ncbi:MAG: hypothetical protein QE487_13740 [Fluviicola sp.]|nr:hypothetical protein [Fluviicola sp.]